MPIVSLDFTNRKILDYFEGGNSYVPVTELLYVHRHPLVQPNFMTQIEALVLETSEALSGKNVQGPIATKFVDLSVELGSLVSDISEKSAPQILHVLRELYSFCNELLKKYA